MEIVIYTIGFAGKNAHEFFTKLKDSGVKAVIDVRLNNTSQLAGFTKAQDLPYFLQEIACIKYVHKPELAPTKDILNAYKKKKLTGRNTRNDSVNCFLNAILKPS